MARKKYKQKYKSKREDFRKGGRVKAAVGGMQKAPMNRRRPPMSIQREEELKELKPVQPVRKPIAQKPQKPVQPGSLTTGGLGGNLKTGTPATPRDLPTGAAKAPVKKPIGNISIGGVGGGKPIQPKPPVNGRKMITGREELERANPSLRSDTIEPRLTNTLARPIPGQPIGTRRGAAPTTSEEKLKQVDSSGNILKDRLMGRQPGETAEQYRARTAGQFTPNPNQQTFTSIEEAAAAKSGLTLEEYKAQQEENVNMQTNDVARTSQAFQISPRRQREAVNPSTGQSYTPEEKRALDASIDQTDFKRSTQAQQTSQAFQQAPVEPKRPDVVQPTVQPTLPRFPEEGRPRDDILFAQQEATQQALDDLERRFSEGNFTGYAPEDLAFLGDKITDAINKGAVNQNTTEGWWTDSGYDNMSDALQSGQFTFKDGQWVLKDGTENQEQEAIDEELITARGRAEQILQGDMTGIPMAEAPKEVEVGELGEAKTMAEREALEAQLAEVGAAPEAATIEDVTTAKTPEQLQAETYRAELVTAIPDIEPIIGELSDDAIAKVSEISKLSGPAVAKEISQKAIDASKADTVEGILSAGAFVPEVDDLTPEKVSETPDAEAKQRQALTGEAAVGAAAQIVDQVGYEAAKRRPVKGTAAKGAAASMIAEVSELPPEITAAIVEDPATVEAQLDTGADPEVVAAIAALPEEALVSSQMESLLGGLEDGNIPAWARPAVDAINSNMAARGLSVSTVGRDSLFNAIIQSAMPMAQSNAQALQQRASQNLSNQQQANLQEASQIQQIRMQNLANRQDAASQTAQFAQQMGVLQSQFKQEAVMTTAQQQQQTRTQNLQNRQQAAVLNTQNQQAMNAQNLGNEQQMELANLEIMNQTERENMTAENQERLAEMNIAAEFIAKNADFKQQMNLANLSNDQQMKLANLSALNQASADNLNAEQQTELANLNKTMQVNIKNAELAQQMGIANLNVDQQRAMANANTVANMDMANFNNEQQVVLANSKFMQTATLANFDAEQQTIMQNATAMASLDLATVDQRTKLAVTNAQSFLSMDMANLSNRQQASMLKSQMQQQQLLSNQSASNAAAQFNASSENQTNQFMSSLAAQIEQFNANQLNTAEQFNVSQTNARDALEFQVEADLEKANASMVNQINQFNEQTAFERDKFNTSNAQAIEQSNLAWRRQANMANTAAANQVAMQNVQNAFNMTSQAQSFLWQELRDQANYTFQSAENEENRKAQLYAQALANEGGSAENWKNNVSSIGTLINTIFGGK